MMGKHFASLFLCLLLIMAAGSLTASAQTVTEPLLVIERINMEQSVLAGETFYITLVVKNHGEQPAFNLNAEIKLHERDGFQSGTAADR